MWIRHKCGPTKGTIICCNWSLMLILTWAVPNSGGARAYVSPCYQYDLQLRETKKLKGTMFGSKEHFSPITHLISNSGITGRGAECPPETSNWEIFADVSGKKRQGKRERGWKLRRKEGKLLKGRWKIWNGSKKVIKEGKDLSFFFFLLFTFENDGNLFWIYQNGNFLQGKSISHREKNQEKWLCPLRKICLLRPWSQRQKRKCSLLNFDLYNNVCWFRL